MGETTPELRVGDRERRAVDDRLLAAVGDGVLTLHEYDERSALLWQARTRSELDALQADLPGAAGSAATLPAVPGGAPQRVVAVLSEDRFRGAVAPGQEVRGYAVLGKAVVDLRSSGVPDGTRVRVRAVLGDVEVQVPDGASVQLSGLTVLGDRRVTVTSGAGPAVHVDAVAVLGSVSVTHGDGSTPSVPPLPAQQSATSRSVAHTGHGGRLGHTLRRGKAALVPAAILGAVLLAGPDSVSVFGNSVEQVTADDRNVQVSTLFGNVTVVVPDGSRVDSSGFVVFGNTECDACTDVGGEGEAYEVRSLGAFGNVEILTASQYAAEQAADEEDDRRDDQRDRMDDEDEDDDG